MNKKLRVVVIGVGSLGQHHARVFSTLPEVELVGVVDVHEAQAKRIAERQGCPAFTDYHAILDKIDAASIAAPTAVHYEIARELLQKGIHTFIEKPITTDAGQARELVGISQKKSLLLQVGHIERFNPAVIKAQQFINEPRYIEALRLGPYDARAAQTGIILDLMIHDLDIVLFLVHSEVVAIDAIGTSLLTEHEDIATCHLNFKNGCVANITASRVTKEKMRKIRIFQKDAYLSLDYAAQKLKVIRKRGSSRIVRSMHDIEIIRPRLKKSDQLTLELSAFIESIRHSRKPVVSGEHGLNALELGLKILDKIRETYGKL
jgi:predicted dehydrogenase